MTQSFAVRPLGVLDLDLASRLHGEAFAAMGERAWSRQDVAELLASPGVAGLALEVDGRDTGFALYRVVAEEAELLTLAVRTADRRLGMGRALLRAVIDRVRTQGAQFLFLEVGADNPAARALYDRTGFVTVGQRAAYYRRGDLPAADALVMRLALR